MLFLVTRKGINTDERRAKKLFHEKIFKNHEILWSAFLEEENNYCSPEEIVKKFVNWCLNR